MIIVAHHRKRWIDCLKVQFKDIFLKSNELIVQKISTQIMENKDKWLKMGDWKTKDCMFIHKHDCNIQALEMTLKSVVYEHIAC